MADVQIQLCSSGFAFHHLNYFCFALLIIEFPALVINEGRVLDGITSSIIRSQLILNALQTCACNEVEILLRN